MKLTTLLSILTVALLIVMPMSRANASTPNPETDFITENDGTGVTIVAYAGSTMDVVIPQTIGGLPVKAIGAWAFRNIGFTSLQLPEGLEVIGADSLNDNRLTTLVIPSTVKVIGDYALANNRLTSLTLPEGVEIIGESAFENNNLITLTIPKSMQLLKNRAFANSYFTVITVNSEDLIYTGTQVFHSDYRTNSDILLKSTSTSTAKDYATLVWHGFESTDYKQDILKTQIQSGEFTLDIGKAQVLNGIKLGRDSQQIKATFGNSVKVIDARGTQEGWRLSVSATPLQVAEPVGGFVEGTQPYVLPQGVISLQPINSITRIGVGTGDIPERVITDATIIDSGAVTIAKADKGKGMGEFELNFNHESIIMTVDATMVKIDKTNYPEGDTPYESTITWELVSAP